MSQENVEVVRRFIEALPRAQASGDWQPVLAEVDPDVEIDDLDISLDTERYRGHDSVGKWIVNLYGYGQSIETFRETYAQWGAWIILLKGLTPIPYKLVTLASGFAGYNFGLFVLLSIVTRSLRFFLVAGLLYVYGEPIRGFLERRLEAVALGMVAVIISGFVIVKYVV